jgi:hypothetical protein
VDFPSRRRHGESPSNGSSSKRNLHGINRRTHPRDGISEKLGSISGGESRSKNNLHGGDMSDIRDEIT